MPVLLKLLSVHGCICLIGAIFTLTPLATFRIDGRRVTYSDWWLTGPGASVFFALAVIGAATLCLLLRVRLAEIYYTFSVAIALLVLHVSEAGIAVILSEIAFLVSVYAYLRFSSGVRRYLVASGP